MSSMWDKLPTKNTKWGNVKGSWDDLRKKEERQAELEAEEERRRTAKDNIAAFNDQQNDWYGKCRFCGTERKGTLKELSAPCECQKVKDA